MNVPLTMSVFDYKARITYNKKMIKLDKMVVPVIDKQGMNTTINAVGHGKINCNKKDVTNITSYNKLRGDSPVTFVNQWLVSEDNQSLMYPNTDEIDMMYYDIEVLTVGDGRFPHPGTVPIIMIGAQINDQEIKVFSNYDDSNPKSGDYQLIEDFLNWIVEKDPDIYVGYNSYQFDMPTIIERCKFLGLEWRRLYRIYKIINEQYPEQLDGAIDLIDRYVEKTASVSEYLGRIHYDVFVVDVKRDQGLTDLKNKKLKTMAAHFGGENIIILDEGDITNTQWMFRETFDKLVEYQKSDVRQTKLVASRYFPVNVALAEELEIPLEHIIARSDGTASTLFLLKYMQKENIYAIDGNGNRYIDLYERHTKYEGAVNGMYHTGYFENLSKFDFKNMYPSAMYTWNLGVDTVKYLGTDPLGDYEFVRKDDFLYMSLPDANFAVNVKIKVDMSKKSLSCKAIDDLWKNRAHHKDIMKNSEYGSDEYNTADTNQSTYKILLNSIYGLQGNIHSIGDLPIAIAVTALCRLTTNFVHDYMGDEHVIAIDTDGLVTNRKYTEEELNTSIAKFIEDETTIPIADSKMILEDEWGDSVVTGWMYKMKNYILKKDGTIIKHGVAFKASSKPAVFDYWLDIIIKWRMENKITKQEMYEEIAKYPELDYNKFIAKMRIGKDPKDNNNMKTTETNIGNLYQQYKDMKGSTLGVGDTMEFIYAINNTSGHPYFKIAEFSTKKDLNVAKYETIKEKLFSYFNLQDQHESELLISNKEIEQEIDKETDDYSFLF